MKRGREEMRRALLIKQVVDRVAAQGKLVCIGARLEELLGFPIENYPDEIMSLDLLPTMDGFKFIAWTAEFEPVECHQYLIGETFVTSADCPIVGWKPIRNTPLDGRIKVVDLCKR